MMKQIPDSPTFRAFNPWRFPATPPSVSLVSHVQSTCEAFEAENGLRQRKRREADQRSFLRSLEAVICDLIHVYHVGDNDCLGVSRSKTILGGKTRYRSPVYSKVFPDILDLLAQPALGWIVQEVGVQGPQEGLEQTKIWPGPALMTAMETFQVDHRDIRTNNEGEVIILKREKADRWDRGAKVEYPETEATRALREAVKGINDWLETADITLAPPQGVILPYDPTEKRLRRIFTRGRFDRGGRLFDGFWQDMKKTERLDYIRIDGSQVVELDFSAMVLRTLYGLVGVDPGDDDLYRLDELEGNRAGVKKVLNAMIFASKRLERYPKGTRGLFPRGVKVQEVTALIEDRHRPIKHLFHIGFGHEQQFMESNILIDVLRSCQSIGLVALPIHDAILVPEARSDQAKEIMEKTFKDHTGVNARVSLQ